MNARGFSAITTTSITSRNANTRLLPFPRRLSCFSGQRYLFFRLVGKKREATSPPPLVGLWVGIASAFQDSQYPCTCTGENFAGEVLSLLFHHSFGILSCLFRLRSRIRFFHGILAWQVDRGPLWAMVRRGGSVSCLRLSCSGNRSCECARMDGPSPFLHSGADVSFLRIVAGKKASLGTGSRSERGCRVCWRGGGFALYNFPSLYFCPDRSL